jgi:2-keto-3-deoxy-L-rhamnonate aldolase RhmA
MSHNQLRTLWSNGETAYGLWCVTGAPFAVEMMALEGPNYVCLDIQHGI